SSVPMRSSARPPSTAGRKTRRGKRPRPEAQRSRPICVHTDLASTDTSTKGRLMMTTCSLVRLNSPSRRLALGLLAALFAMPALIGAAEAAGLDEIKKRGLIVATEDDFRPFEFVKDG